MLAETAACIKGFSEAHTGVERHRRARQVGHRHVRLVEHGGDAGDDFQYALVRGQRASRAREHGRRESRSGCGRRG
jgi:hypothetical protein